CAGCLDLATCGNGTLDAFELCDPGLPGSCPANQICLLCAVCGSTTPKQAKLYQGEFVKAYDECVAPDTATSNAFPACTGAVESDATCTFTSKGKGKWQAKLNPNGVDQIPHTSDDGDIAVVAMVGGLSAGCQGQTLTLAGSVRTTTDDCNNET